MADGVVPFPGLFVKVQDSGLLWASRRWSQLSTSQPSSQALFSCQGRSCLDLWAESSPGPSRGGSGGSSELYYLSVKGVGGHVRRELARAAIRSGQRGRVLSVRDCLFPEMQVSLEVYSPGTSPSEWRFYCASWGCEPARDEPPIFERSTQTVGGESGSSILVSDVRCSLDWLEFELIDDQLEPEIFAHLYDTNPLLGPPAFNRSTLRAQWCLVKNSTRVAGGVRAVRPAAPLQLYQGGYLVLSTTPDDYTAPPPGALLWAHWQKRPTVHLPWGST
jgi:hypothetical protein